MSFGGEEKKWLERRDSVAIMPLSLWRDRKSDPVKGIIIRRGGRGEKDIRSKPIKGRDVCSCRGWDRSFFAGKN